jgi:hypothetical protein
MWCGGGALERGDGAALEPLAQLGDALGGVGAAAFPVKAAELVLSQAASKGEGRGGLGEVPVGPDKRVLKCGAAAHSSEVMALPLSPSNNLVMPSVV